jgi:hypothetical protein
MRAKLWKLAEKEWRDLGIGMLRIKRDEGKGKTRMLVRNEVTGKPVVVSPPPPPAGVAYAQRSDGWLTALVAPTRRTSISTSSSRSSAKSRC